MSEYKVIAGRYQIDGSEVVITNPQGRGTLQGILDHYSGIGFELMDTQLDSSLDFGHFAPLKGDLTLWPERCSLLRAR